MSTTTEIRDSVYGEWLANPSPWTEHKDIWPVLGNKGSATEVLSGRRSISKAHAKRLAEFFHVPIDLFV